MVEVLTRMNPDCRELYSIAKGGVNLELALEIPRVHVKPSLGLDVKPWPSHPESQPNIYGMPKEPHWLVRAPWNHGK